MMPGPAPAVRSTTPEQLPDGTFLSARAASPQAAAAADVPAAPQVTPFQVVLDDSSPEAFIRSVAPYAARVSKATGIPPEALIGMAANETGFGKYASHNNLFGIKGTGPAGTFSTPTWEDYGNGPVTIVDNFRAYHSPAESFMDFANLVTTSPRYKGAVGQTTVAGFVGGLKAGGYMTDPDYVAKISGITTRYSSVIQQSLAASSATGAVPVASAPPPAAASAARPSAGVTVPNQFAIGLPTDEALAACGPVAAIAFAQVYGRNPTPTEAMDLAKQSGWTAEGGMNGIYNEKRLLDKLNLPSQLELGQPWDHIQAQALQHQPVILATPGHYFVIDGYDPKTGAYHVGQSGKVYRNGSDWMTPGQIEALAGTPSGALYTVHPMANQPQAHQVLPPLDLGNTPAPPPVPVAAPPPVAREVLPPLDLGNTPPPPPIPSPTPAPPPPEAAPVTFIPVRDMPPPTLATANAQAPAPQVVHDAPPPTLASAPEVAQYADPPTISMSLADEPPPPTAQSPATPAAQASAGPITPAPVAPPADTAQAAPNLAHPGMAVGAIAAGAQRPQPVPPPPPARRRFDDDLDVDV